MFTALSPDFPDIAAGVDQVGWCHMEWTGRSYVFLAATLLLLAGAIRLYVDKVEHSRGPVLLGAHSTGCTEHAFRLDTHVVGCKADMAHVPNAGSVVQRGTAKSIFVGD